MQCRMIRIMRLMKTTVTFLMKDRKARLTAPYRHTNSSVIQTSYFYIDGPEDDLSDASGNYQDVSDEPDEPEGSEGPVSDDEDAPGSEEGSEGPSEGPSEEGDSDDAPGSDDDDEGPEDDDGNHVCHCSECVRES
jgi:hypothetical protein